MISYVRCEAFDPQFQLHFAVAAAVPFLKEGGRKRGFNASSKASAKMRKLGTHERAMAG